MSSINFLGPGGPQFARRILCLCLFIALPDFATAEESRTNGTGLLLVAIKGDRSLAIIDPRAGTRLARVPVNGETGHEVVASPDGRLAFVPIYGNSGVGGQGTDGQLVRVIDIGKRELSGTFDYGKGVRPHCAVFGPKDNLLYVTAELENAVSVIDPRTLRVEASIPTGQAESHMLAITHDGRRGYTANVGPGTVSVLDLENKKLSAIVPVSTRVQRVSISSDDKWVFTADQAQPRIAMISAASNSVSSWITLPDKGYGTAPTPDGRWLLVAIPRISQVVAVDLASMKISRTLEVPRAPQEILVQPDGSVAYVSCDASSQVVVVDLRDWKLEKVIDAGPGADGLAWAPSL